MKRPKELLPTTRICFSGTVATGFVLGKEASRSDLSPVHVHSGQDAPLYCEMVRSASLIVSC